MRGLGILILIVIFFWLIWPMISRWLKRKAVEKAEDYMRSSMGMPPRDKRRKAERGARYGDEDRYYSRSHTQSKERNDRERRPIIPKEYAEDVEFTETKDYSSREKEKTTSDKIENYHESQISDVEWTEVKKPHSK